MNGAQKSITGAYAVIVAMLMVKHDVLGTGGQLAALFRKPADTPPTPYIPTAQLSPAQQEVAAAVPGHPGQTYNPAFSSPV